MANEAMANKTARIIMKTRYDKSGAKAGGYVNYIATRDGVEFLNEQANYLQYIATRPGVEKQGKHGLFGDTDGIDLDEARDTVQNHPGKVWQHIFSIRREDAKRLGYDNAEAWKDLLRSHRNDIAVAMKINPSDFRWYAAFHNEGDHPHVHMVVWSDKPERGYLTEEGIKKIKSVLANDIFKFEMLQLYQQSSEQRNELIAQAREELKQITEFIPQNVQDPELEQRLLELAKKLKPLKGRKSYGYLPKSLKKEVNSIMEQLMSRPELDECYRQWQKVRTEITDYYGSTQQSDVPITEKPEFRPVKNAIIQTAMVMGKKQETAVRAGVTAVSGLVSTIAQIIADTPPAQKRQLLHIDRKRWQELARKRQALGQRGNIEQTM